jgi:alpha-tubulin suppressor-like RCC1 family protein
LGNTTNYSSPKQVGSLTNWSVVVGGETQFAISIKTDGTLWSWGRNFAGQLGLGNITYYSSPKQVGARTTWTVIASGGRNTLAIAVL